MTDTALPSVRNSLIDPNSGVTYHVMAYREITREELIFSVRTYLASKGRKKPKKGTEVTIVTIIGA